MTGGAGSIARGSRRASATAGRPRSAVVVTVLALLCLQGSLAAAQRARDAGRSRFTDCDSFHGVFRELGRYTSDFPVGAPVRGRRPDDLKFDNYMFLGSDLLGCAPDCGRAQGLRSRETSFALSYRNGTLHWAVLQSPSGRVVARGDRPWECEKGRLVASSSGWVNGIPYGILAFGKATEKNFLMVNEAGWLVAFDRTTMKGTAFLVIPTVGSTIRNWMEFPPDSEVQVDFEALFGGSGPVQEPVEATERRSLVERGSGAFVGPTAFRLVRGEPQWIGELLFLVEEVAIERRADDYFETRATLSVSANGENRKVELRRDHSGGPLELVEVFGREISLEIASARRRPVYARVWVLPERPELEASQGTPVRQVLKQGLATQVGDLELTLEEADHQDRDIVVGERGGVAISDQTARITVARGDVRESLELRRDHARGMLFEQALGREIALEVAVLHQKPTRALAVVWLRDPS